MDRRAELTPPDHRRKSQPPDAAVTRRYPVQVRATYVRLPRRRSSMPVIEWGSPQLTV